MISNEELKSVINIKLKQEGFANHMLKSYNWFITEGISDVIQSCQDIVIENCKIDGMGRRLTFFDHTIDYPNVTEMDNEVRRLFPSEARLRNITYSSDVIIMMREVIESKNDSPSITNLHRIQVSIPTMLKSCKCNLGKLTQSELVEKDECMYDYGGYFIINGKERVIVSQERLCYNQIYVFKQKPREKYSVISETRSIIVSGTKPSLIVAKYEPVKSFIKFDLPFLPKSIPAGMLFRIFEVPSKEDIIKILDLDEIELKNIKIRMIIQKIFKEYETFHTRDEVLSYLISQSFDCINDQNKMEEIDKKFRNECFIHLDNNEKTKIMFFGYVIKRMIGVIGPKNLPEDDRDHYVNKRVDVAGVLLNDLFRILFNSFVKNLKTCIEKKNEKLVSLLRKCSDSIITRGFKYSMATGNWGVQKSLNTKTGVSQILNRINHTSMISHLRRVMTPTGKEGKMTKVRQLHSSQWGIIDPAETPEGSPCGIVKNLTMTADITLPSQIIPIINLITSFEEFKSISEITFDDISKKTKILIDGKWVGSCDTDKAVKMKNKIKSSKKNSIISNSTSIQYDDVYNEIRIFADFGRCIRPVLPIDGNGNLLLTKKDIETLSWDEMLNKGVVSLVDSNDLEDSFVALWINEITEKHDFCEIHPSIILGVCASLIPFPDHNQSPRNSYYAAMCKQAIGIDTTNTMLRMDTMSHSLNYPQRPIVTTSDVGDIFDRDYASYDQLPAGQNVILAICTYTGFNQEDSIIVKKEAIERGMFTSVFCRTYTCEVGENITEEIECPPKDIRIQHRDYSKLNANGLVKTGMFVSQGTVIVGKTIVKDGVKSDCSLVLKQGEEGVVEKVVKTTNEGGFHIVKVKLRSLRIPEIGDKFVSRLAQKGTIGMIMPSCDMPFTSEGIVPDVILNPHAIPSRMTINKLLECVLGKSSIVQGGDAKFKDGSIFSEVNLDKICDSLRKSGYESMGNETMYNGFTGEPLESKVFIGPIFYQKLRHMVMDKEHSRARGTVQLLTQQPLAGRSRDGGLRFGSMECDAVTSYGAPSLLNERLFHSSDAYEIFICNDCHNNNATKVSCYSCKSSNTEKVKIPYACKLILQELQALGLSIKIRSTNE